MSMKSYFDCVVIGAGVAGMTSAIYLKRYDMNVLLLEKGAPGGQITQTPKVENYPGFVNIDGASLAMNMFEQVSHLGIEYRYGKVTRIESTESDKTIYTETEEIHTKAIIIATGRVPRRLGLTNENGLVGRGISWCATCDGLFYKDEEIAVIGGGNSALEESIFLAKMCKKVHILYRGKNLRADSILQDRIKELKNVKIHYDTVVTELKETDDCLSSIVVRENEEEKELTVKAVFIYIGFEPDTKFLENLGIKLEDKYIIVNSQMETSIEGIFACGDVIKKDLYQLTTAVGEGSTAAYCVKNYLLKK